MLKQEPLNQQELQNANPKRSRKWPLVLLEFGLAALITIFFARGFVFNMLDKTLTEGSDVYENLWNYWQWRHNFFGRLVNPYFTDYVYYPTGINLYLHPFQPLVSWSAVAAQAVFGQILGANLVILLSLVLATWSAYQLFWYISGHRLGAWVGAIIFIWCNSWQWDFFTSGQVNLLSVQWLPLYTLCLLHAFDATIGRQQWVWTLLTTLCLVAAALTDWYYVLHLIILTVLTTLFYLVARTTTWQERGLVFGKAALIGGGWLALISPLLLNMLAQSKDRLWYVPSQSQSVLRSVDLLSFILPNGHHPLYGNLATALPTPLYTAYNPSGITGSFNPGYGPLILAGFAVVVGIRFKTVRFGLWVWLAGSFAMLALGPLLHFNGVVLDAIKLPYWLLYNAPGLNVTRDPSNFSVPYLLAIAALASLGMRQLGGWVARRWPTKRPVGRWKLAPVSALGAAMVIIIGAEFYFLPIEMNLDPVPEFYRTTLAADKEDYAILEVPSHVQDGGLEHTRMFYQTFHQKKLMGGQLARDHKRLSPTDFLSHSPFFPEALLNDSHTLPTQADMLERPRFPEASAALLNYFNFRYIVLYPNALKPGQQEAAEVFLRRALGPDPRPVYADNLIKAYKVPPVAPSLPIPTILAEVGQGWFKPDTKDGQVWRWGQFGQSAEIYLVNMTSKPVRARLDFAAFSYAVPRNLRLTLNYERDIANYPLAASPPGQPRAEKNFGLEVELKPGNNILTMFTFEQPVIPFNLTKGEDDDRRKLSYGIRDFRLTVL